MESSENLNYSWNNLSEWVIDEYEKQNENEELITPLILRGLLEANDSKNIITKDEKIYTKNDFEKITKFICQKYQRSFTPNLFCEKKNCLDVCPIIPIQSK